MNNFIKKSITGIILWILAIVVFFFFTPIYTAFTMFGILVFVLIFEWPKFFPKKDMAFFLLTLFYPILPFSLIIYMSVFEQYRSLLFFMFIMVFSHDTGGELCGRLLGKHKLAQKISPQKTWEGLFGGLIFTFAVITTIDWIFNMKITVWTLALLTITVSTVATLGDLFESWFKRRAEIKDSGFILPGHGGFLDRFDSLLPTVFIFFTFRNYLVELFKISA